mgnify:FL=1|tara:strand:- start:536 stop:919 length:384 start_codon:yes stop_codon:yes gene_type:complete
MTKKLLRKVLGRDLLGNLLRVGNYLTLPKPIERMPNEQKSIDEKMKDLSLYDYSTCPFCIKVRRFMHEKNISIQILDAANNETHKSDLLAYGGKQQVPCLRIPQQTSDDIWLYESDDIISYLQRQIL